MFGIDEGRLFGPGKRGANLGFRDMNLLLPDAAEGMDVCASGSAQGSRQHGAAAPAPFPLPQDKRNTPYRPAQGQGQRFGVLPLPAMR